MVNKENNKFNLRKNILTLFCVIFGLSLATFIFACQPPSVLTKEATNVALSTATLNGEVTNMGSSPQVTVWFQYGLTTYYGPETSHQLRYGVGVFSANIFNLSPCTLYHFRAIAKNEFGISYGEDKTFKTECPLTTVDIKANDSDGPITIPYNSSVTLTWESENANSCYALDDWSGPKPISGFGFTGNLISSKKYTIECSGTAGSASDSVVVNIASNTPPIVDAGPDKEIYEGESVVLEGSAQDSDGDPLTYYWHCDGGGLSNSSFIQPIFYAPFVSLDTIYTCTLSAWDPRGGSDSDSMEVLVRKHESPTLFVFLTPNPSSGCAPLNNVDLTATISGTATGEITYFFDCNNDLAWEKTIVSSGASYTAYDICHYSVSGTYTARVRAEREYLSAENIAYINVHSCYSAPTVDIKANGSDGPITISYNSSVNLSWTSDNTNYCYASGGWTGSKITSGSESTGSLISSRTYTITCSGAAGSALDSVTVNVSGISSYFLTVEKLVRNLSDGTAFLDSVLADPNEVVSFLIRVRADGSSYFQNVTIRDTLPSQIIYRGNLEIDGIPSAGNITSGLNIGNLSPNQTRTITFDAQIAGSDQFAFGQTKLINTSLAYTTNISDSDTAQIIVTKQAVAGAATGVSTGFTDNIFLDSFFLPLVIALAIVWAFKSHLIQFEEWLDLRKEQYRKYKTRKTLQFKIAQIKAREFFQKKVL